MHEGRVVSTRQPGPAKDDSLLAFLCVTRRLSEEQFRGLLTIQRESGRDIEDLLVNGRYVDADELASYVERQILDDLMRIVRWDNGSYRFDPNARWPHTPLVMLSMEGVMIEAARRMDEQKRYVSLFKDPYELLGVRDLPDPDDPLSDEEREIFGIVDGLHTVAEVVDAAPLSEYEAYEALQRMHDERWIEFVGRRDPGVTPASAVVAGPARPRNIVARELAIAACIVVAIVGLRAASSVLPLRPGHDPRSDVFATTQVRDLRYALELYRRERGTYPRQLQELVEDRWVAADQALLPGYEIQYRAAEGGQSYQIDLKHER